MIPIVFRRPMSVAACASSMKANCSINLIWVLGLCNCGFISESDSNYQYCWYSYYSTPPPPPLLYITSSLNPLPPYIHHLYYLTFDFGIRCTIFCLFTAVELAVVRLKLLLCVEIGFTLPALVTQAAVDRAVGSSEKRSSGSVEPAAS